MAHLGGRRPGKAAKFPAPAGDSMQLQHPIQCDLALRDHDHWDQIGPALPIPRAESRRGANRSSAFRFDRRIWDSPEAVVFCLPRGRLGAVAAKKHGSAVLGDLP